MDNKRLRRLREEKGMEQQEVADKLGISRSTMGMYELGKREPNDEIKKRIADFFNCSVDYLIGYSDYRGDKNMGIFTDMNEIEKRIGEIKGFAKETLDKMVEMKMTHDDYDYFKHTLDNFVSRRQIGKK